MAKADSNNTETPPVKHVLSATSLIVGEGMPGDTPEEAQARSALVDFMRQHPTPPPGKTKDDFRKEWCKCYRISRRSFLVIWDWAIQRSGSIAYKKQGPRGPLRNPRRPRNS
jgi:hypothetical protein